LYYTISYLLFVFSLGFIITFILTPIIAKIMKNYNKVGIDIHKVEKPKIPEICGLAILIGTILTAIFLIFLNIQNKVDYISFILCGMIAGMIGFYDDLKSLRANKKAVLTAFACIPIFLLGTYHPYPILPFIGGVRLTIVYPILIPFAIAIPSNAINMMDVFNGSMTGTCAIISFTMIICLFLVGKFECALLATVLLGCLLAFYFYNKYPAKVFSGDTGSLFIGTSIGSLAVIGNIEVATVVALFPHIMNAFYGLATVGKLYERKDLKIRPTRLLPNNKLDITDEIKAPMTLARIILAREPLEEYKVVRIMILLTLFSSILAIITQIIILVM
jgi:UDP-N-acetylglucosamine--dolichyl-phosphate N-acetylglucosaminephosphotransferase